MKNMWFSKKDYLSSALFGSILVSLTVGTLTLMDWDKPDEIQAYSTAEVEEYHTPVVTWTEYDVPDGKTSFKSYMSWRAITNTRSAQYKLQQECWTDKNGLRRYDEYYVIALGSYYTDDIGDTFRITLDNGKSFKAVVGDFKADRHTDELNQYTPTESCGKCVLEFVVDTKALNSTARKMGDISYIKGCDGYVEKKEKLEE